MHSTQTRTSNSIPRADITNLSQHFFLLNFDMASEFSVPFQVTGVECTYNISILSDGIQCFHFIDEKNLEQGMEMNCSRLLCKLGLSS